MFFRLVLLCFLIGVRSASAGAAETENLNRAQTHFRAGKTLYDLGKFTDAIREFAAGYALAPRPEFLLNLAQAYRRSGELEQAKEMFERYLEKAPAGARERVAAKEMIVQLEGELEAQRALHRQEQASAPREVSPAAVPLPVPLPVVEHAPGVAVVAPPIAEPSSARHLAWIIPVGIAVAAGIGAGVFLATRSPPDACAGAGPLGCFDLRPR